MTFPKYSFHCRFGFFLDDWKLWEQLPCAFRDYPLTLSCGLVRRTLTSRVTSNRQSLAGSVLDRQEGHWAGLKSLGRLAKKSHCCSLSLLGVAVVVNCWKLRWARIFGLLSQAWGRGVPVDEDEVLYLNVWAFLPKVLPAADVERGVTVFHYCLKY